jgi:hypothetical protein
MFPEGVDVHWEAESRMVWNEQQNTREERAGLPGQLDSRARRLAAVSAFAAEDEKLRAPCDA